MNFNATDGGLGWLKRCIGDLAQSNLSRTLRATKRLSPVDILVDGKQLVDFGSNDYLGLTCDSRLAQAATDAINEYGWGSGASPLITGRTELHAELEQQIAALKRTEAAIVFPSGYAVNSSVISALVGSDDLILSDEKNHASIIDGCRLSKASLRVYPHGQLNEIPHLIGHHVGRTLIVTDGLFSMDGDLARLDKLAEIAKEYGAMLMVDEAHATGVFGQNGGGVTEQQSVNVDIHVGTLSKALGCHGGFVAGSQELIHWISNRARAYVFSTAGPPANCAAALKSLEIIRDEPHLRTALLHQATWLRNQLVERGWDIGESQSQIVPVYLHEPSRAMYYSNALLDAGFLVPGIRPPSVPDGQSLLRISLNAAHSQAALHQLLDALERAREAEKISKSVG